jgi:hypothetical protein
VIELRVITPDDWRTWRRLRLATLAEALYRRNGFRLTGEFGDLMPDGVSREHIMAKDLTVGA